MVLISGWLLTGKNCQRWKESGKICCNAGGIDLWEKIKIRVAQINVDWDWSRTEKAEQKNVTLFICTKKRRRISQYHARSLAITSRVKFGGRKSSLFISRWLSETCSYAWHIPFPPTKLWSKNSWNICGTSHAILFSLMVYVSHWALTYLFWLCALLEREVLLQVVLELVPLILMKALEVIPWPINK